jgi:hypothetical protein
MSLLKENAAVSFATFLCFASLYGHAFFLKLKGLLA